jgi:hypothetical protein
MNIRKIAEAKFQIKEPHQSWISIRCTCLTQDIAQLNPQAEMENPLSQWMISPMSSRTFQTYHLNEELQLEIQQIIQLSEVF